MKQIVFLKSTCVCVIPWKKISGLIYMKKVYFMSLLSTTLMIIVIQFCFDVTVFFYKPVQYQFVLQQNYVVMFSHRYNKKMQWGACVFDNITHKPNPRSVATHIRAHRHTYVRTTHEQCITEGTKTGWIPLSVTLTNSLPNTLLQIKKRRALFKLFINKHRAGYIQSSPWA